MAGRCVVVTVSSTRGRGYLHARATAPGHGSDGTRTRDHQRPARRVRHHASSTLEVRTTDLAKLPQILAAFGGASIEGPEFDVSDTTAARQEATRIALQRARPLTGRHAGQPDQRQEPSTTCRSARFCANAAWRVGQAIVYSAPSWIATTCC